MWEMFKRRPAKDYYGPSPSELIRIGLAFLLFLAGMYVIFRSFFGPPLIGPDTISQLKPLERLHPAQSAIISRQQTQENLQNEARKAQALKDRQNEVPGSVSVGIGP